MLYLTSKQRVEYIRGAIRSQSHAVYSTYMTSSYHTVEARSPLQHSFLQSESTGVEWEFIHADRVCEINILENAILWNLLNQRVTG